MNASYPEIYPPLLCNYHQTHKKSLQCIRHVTHYIIRFKPVIAPETRSTIEVDRGETESDAVGKPWGICLPPAMTWEEPVCHSQIGAAQMSLSAAVSARCAVWKSSVMAYLMVIVRGGERPPCLHAGICGVQSGGPRSSSSGAETGGRREMVRFHSSSFFQISSANKNKFYMVSQDIRRHVSDVSNGRQYVKQ